MKRTKSNPCDDKLKEILLQWDQKTFVSAVCEGNRCIAQVADFYWERLYLELGKDHLTKSQLAAHIAVMPVLNATDRCVAAMDVAVELAGGNRHKGQSLAGYARLLPQLYGSGTDAHLIEAYNHARQGDIVPCVEHAVHYAANMPSHKTLRRMLNYWMVQK